jgi:hypothetical protein
MATTRYWVVGGEFRSPEFDALVDGSGRFWGPFDMRSDAESVWREESEKMPLELLHALYHREGGCRPTRLVARAPKSACLEPVGCQ